MKNLSKFQKFIFIICIFLPSILMTVPNIIGYFNQNEENIYTWSYFAGGSDERHYAMFLRQSYEGSFFTKEQWTSEPQEGRFLLLFHFIIGKIGSLLKITPLQLLALWQLSRLITGPLLILSVWIFLGFYFKDETYRLLALFFVSFSGGLGWIFWIFFKFIMPNEELLVKLTTDLRYADSWQTFGSTFNPMWLLGLTVFGWIFIFILKYHKTNKIKYFILSSFLVPLLFFIHPYNWFPMIFIMSVFFLIITIKKKDLVKTTVSTIKKMFLFFLPNLIVIIYLIWATKDRVFLLSSFYMVSDYTFRNTIQSFAIGYGLILLLAIFGIKYFLNKDSKIKRYILGFWVVVVFILSPQNLFIQGIKFQHLLHIPLCVLATYGLKNILKKVKNKTNKKYVILAFALLVIPSNIIIVSQISDQFINNYAYYKGSYFEENSYYLSKGHFDATSFLDKQKNGVVFIEQNFNSYVPWLSNKPIFFGRWDLTLNYKNKTTTYDLICNENVATDIKIANLKKNNITYFYTEQYYNNSNISNIFANDEVYIYKVIG